MKPETLSPSAMRLVDFLGELGGRWGNPALPCRVHACLYLVARPVEEAEIRRLLGLDSPALADALNWLKAFGLVDAAPPDRWRTDSDPWTVLMWPWRNADVVSWPPRSNCCVHATARRRARAPATALCVCRSANF